MTDDIKPDPTMPAVTLRLSEWRASTYGACMRRSWVVADKVRCVAASVRPHDLYVDLPFGQATVCRNCNGIEDGMRIADEMLRKWIEEAGG